MAVAHLSVNLRLRHQRGNRIHNENIHRPRAHHRLRNIQGLLTGIRLRNIEIVNIHADCLRIAGIECVLRINKSGNSSSLLYLRNGMKRQSRLT